MGIPASKADRVISVDSLQDVPVLQRISLPGQRRIYLITLGISDAVMIATALMVAWYIRIGGGVLSYEGPTMLQGYVQMTMVAVFVYLLIFGLNDLYDFRQLLGGPQEYQAVFRACSYGMVAIVFITFMQRTTPLSRGWLLIGWALSIVMVGVSRFLLRRALLWLRRVHGWLISPTLIVGADEHGRAIARQFMVQNSGVNVVGFADDFLPLGREVVFGLSNLGTPNQIPELVAEFGIEQVILVPNAVAWETFQEILRGTGQANGYEVKLSPGFYEFLTTGVQVSQRAFVPLLQMEQARIDGIDKMLKSALDLSLGAFLLLLTSPFAFVISLAILLADGPPVLERHEVLGINGKAFLTSKFRTELTRAVRRSLGMRVPWQIVADPHVSSRVGRLLFFTGLDKLPQLFDVLRGRMSLVGPRTVTCDLEAMHSPWLPNLFTVKPGWTGPWAVGGAQTLEGEMRLALYYIRNWTIWLDMQILFQTAKLVVRQWSQLPWRALQ